MFKSLILLEKNILRSSITALFLLSLPAFAVPPVETLAAAEAFPDHLVVKFEVNADGTMGPVESVTPITLGQEISNDDSAANAVDVALKAEQKLRSECDDKIAVAIADYRRIARHTSHDDIERVTLETVRTCNISCADKQPYGFTRYDSIARVQNPDDRAMAGREACYDVTPATAPSERGQWISQRRFGDINIVGRGQYRNLNMPLYGLYYNSYNPYGNQYFAFSPNPYRWGFGSYRYFIYPF